MEHDLTSTSDEKLERDAATSEHWAHWSAVLLIVGLCIEAAIAGFEPSHASDLGRWGPLAADCLVVAGVWGEVLFASKAGRRQSELRTRSNKRLGEAVERAAQADLARAQLEDKLRPRELNQNQWDLIQTYRGRFDQINIAFETDAETRYFAYSVMMAIHSVGIKAAFIPRAPEVQSFGTLVLEPNGFDGARPRTVQPLIDLFHKSDPIPSLAIVTSVPTDIAESASRLPYDATSTLAQVPMIIVGGRFTVPPAHLPQISNSKATAG